MVSEKVATLQEVAASTGFSVSTVSRVLNSSDFASRDTRKSVIKAAKNLGYIQPRRRRVSHPLSLLEGSPGSLGTCDHLVLLAPEPILDSLRSADWIYRDVVPTLLRVARRIGFQLIVSSYGQDDQWKAAAMAARHIVGVLWLAHDREDLLARISQAVPVVVLDDNSAWLEQTSVMSNSRMVLFKAVKHLRELGHRRIGYFDVDERPNPVTVHCRERLAAYHEAIGHYGLDTDPALCLLEHFGMEEHPQAVARAMDRMAALPSPPTALIAPLGYSIQFLKETRQRGVRVPDDLSIVAIDNAPAAEWVDPALTVVDCVFGRCAEVAVELLLEEKKTPRKCAKTILVEPELIVRKSTAPPRS